MPRKKIVVTKKFLKKEVVIPKREETAVPRAKIESLLAQGKYKQASVVLMNCASDIHPDDFKVFNKEIKNNLKVSSTTTSDYPVPPGGRVTRGPRCPN